MIMTGAAELNLSSFDTSFSPLITSYFDIQFVPAAMAASTKEEFRKSKNRLNPQST
jgi:hypothetical protein